MLEMHNILLLYKILLVLWLLQLQTLVVFLWMILSRADLTLHLLFFSFLIHVLRHALFLFMTSILCFHSFFNFLILLLFFHVLFCRFHLIFLLLILDDFYLLFLHPGLHMFHFFFFLVIFFLFLFRNRNPILLKVKMHRIMSVLCILVNYNNQIYKVHTTILYMKINH